MTVPEPLTPDQWDEEVWEHRQQRMRAKMERTADMLDRMREEASWPKELRWPQRSL